MAATSAHGTLTTRGRNELLIDQGSVKDFDIFVTHRCTDFGMDQGEKTIGNGSVAGWAGSLSATHAQNIVKLQGLAFKNPTLATGIFDAAGARIQVGVAAIGGYGDVLVQRGLWIIPRNFIMGPCAGGDVYSPVTNKSVTAEELGGAALPHQELRRRPRLRRAA